jgi:superfamily II DNA or RNA helicase
LSATPKRQYDSGFEEKIKPILGEIIYEYSYNEAILDGVICPFDLINVEIGLLEHEQNEYDHFNKRLAIEFGKVNVDYEKIRILLQRRAIVSSTASMRVPVVAKLIESQKSQRIIVFFERVSQADQLYDVLIRRNKSVSKYHSKMPPLLRRENLRLFRKSVYDILITCKALDEGLNVPNASVAIIGSSTSSIRQRIQRMGRVLRPYPGKENALIFTVFATESERMHIMRVDSELDSSINTTWLKGGFA